MYTINIEELNNQDWTHANTDPNNYPTPKQPQVRFHQGLLPILRQWLDRIEINQPSTARFLFDILPPLIRSTEYNGGFPRILGSQFIEPT